jgi:hypothetical protein
MPAHCAALAARAMASWDATARLAQNDSGVCPPVDMILDMIS